MTIDTIFNSILENVSDVVVCVDATYKQIRFNTEYSKLIQDLYEVEAKEGASVLEVFEYNVAQIIKSNIQNAINGEKVEEDISLIFKSGMKKTYHTITSPIYEHDQNIRYIIWIAKQISPHLQIGKKKTSSGISIHLYEKDFKYKTFFNHSVVAKSITSLDGKLHINEAFSDLLGYTEEEMNELHWQEITHPDDVEKNTEIVAKIIKGVSDSEQWIKRYIHKTGQIIWTDIITTLLRDEKGIPQFFITEIKDITESKKKEELTEQSIDRLNRAEYATKSGNWELHLDTRLMHTSEGACKIYGIETKIYEYDIVKSMPLDDYRKVLDHAMKDLIEKNIPYDVKFQIQLEHTGEIKDIHSTAIYNAKNRIVFGIIEDITEKNIIERKANELERKYSNLFNSMSEMVVINEMIRDEKGTYVNYRLLECNNAYTRITGINKDKALGGLANELYGTEKPAYLEEFSKVCQTRESIEFKTYFSPMDKHFIISVISLGENIFSTITTDISDIELSRAAIIENNKELENYIYVASHDLRSPLVNIQGFSQRLARHTTELNAIADECTLKEEFKDRMGEITTQKIPKDLNYIQTNVLKMDKLLNGLLQISRTGRVNTNFQLVNTNLLISNVIRSYNFQLTEINANVTIHNLDNCYGDENLLNQLFSNIVSNAIKYRDVQRPLQLLITSEVKYNKVLISIKDNGIGIKPAHLNKIWNVFYRVNVDQEGDGLGLSIAKRIIDKHKGKIWVASVLDGGTIFYIELHKNEFAEI